MLVAVFLYLAFRQKLRLPTPASRAVAIFCLIWLASQCVTDIVRHSAFSDYARGWSMIGLTLIFFVALCTLLYGQPQRIMLYGWGLVAGTTLAFFISPNDYARDYPWKFGLGDPLTLAVILFASREKCPFHWKIALCATIGIVNVILGSRGEGGECMAVALYLLVTRFVQKKAAANSKITMKSKAALMAAIVLGAAGIMWAYQYAATRGVLGEDARQKYAEESGGKYGVLLGGRGDLLGAFAAIYDSPILGHGSWAKDWSYIIAEQQAMALMGYQNSGEVSREELEEGVIPCHSWLFQAWVWAGIAGAAFWAWVFVLVARMLVRVYPVTVALLPIMAFVGFVMLWNILFSPYGATERILFPYYLVLLMTCADMVPRKVERALRPTSSKRIVNIAMIPRPQH
ncbi:MAG TPA: hypothetical protein VGG45_01230 [Terracidiphilus sp.]